MKASDITNFFRDPEGREQIGIALLFCSLLLGGFVLVGGIVLVIAGAKKKP